MSHSYNIKVTIRQVLSMAVIGVVKMREHGTGKLSVICVVILFVFLGVAAWIENAGMPEYNADAIINRVEAEWQYDMIVSAVGICR